MFYGEMLYGEMLLSLNFVMQNNWFSEISKKKFESTKKVFLKLKILTNQIDFILEFVSSISFSFA